jgi:hypothetical protein
MKGVGWPQWLHPPHVRNLLGRRHLCGFDEDCAGCGGRAEDAISVVCGFRKGTPLAHWPSTMLD